jgi:hypothetical protein
MRRANAAAMNLFSWFFGLVAVFFAALVGALIIGAVTGASFWVGFPICAVIGLFLLINFELTADRATKAIQQRVAGRPCPRSGLPVPVGQLECEHCGFDFRTIGA